MKRNVLWVAGGLIAVVALACMALFTGKDEAPAQATARITLDGEVVEEIDLEGLTERKTLTLTGKSGLTNTIVAEHGKIWVAEADCPDQICVNQGAISNSTVPIVCLPNHLVIEIVGGGDGLDAANG